jgi:hypothetical protein
MSYDVGTTLTQRELDHVKNRSARISHRVLRSETPLRPRKKIAKSELLKMVNKIAIFCYCCETDPSPLSLRRNTLGSAR